MSGANDLVTADGDAVVIAVHVQPRAGRTAVVGRHGDALKVRIAAPPVDDRANTATVALIAGMLDVAATGVTVVSGERSRLKRLRVQGIDLETALER
ncbi:MAG: YggU family protein, partial [Acidimicrobiia bacterium]|nr:YggU family protein [Acidimicrobiia bacterium]